jgi:serine/threonine protein kinase
VDGTPFGQYQLIELIGQGGMGEVWRAHDTDTDRIVAIKLLPAHFSKNEDFQRRFRREAHAAARLNSPHVIPIHRYGEIDGRLYVDMRLIDGRDLQTVLADGPIDAGRAVRIVEQVAKALHAAHKVGLMHRDVKPSNILLDDDDFAYLIDFGIARAADQTRLTQSGSAIGTFAYIAPERLDARAKEDARADIYSLACVLYECLTGHPPFDADTTPQVIAAHLHAPPPRPSSTQPNVPAPMDQVIAKGMAKDPHNRYATTIELAHAAHDAITVPIPRPGPPVPVHSPTQPDHLTASAFHGHDTDLVAARRAAPGWQPPPPGSPPPWAQPTPKRPGWRPHIVIPALLGVAVLIGGGIFAAVKISQHHNPTATAPPTHPLPTTPPPNTGPFTGIYTANFGPDTDLDGKPYAGATPTTETWGLRSVCLSSGCVATASRRSGQTIGISTLVFDDAGGRWLAVGLGSGTCVNAPTEYWEVFTVQPHPDGTLAGIYSSTSSNACGSKRAVTFTRTGDVDVNSLPDPASQPPRVVSPAEALHGRYHESETNTNGDKYEYDGAIRTDCLRTGDRCMSYFHAPDFVLALVFGSGKWDYYREFDAQCPGGGTRHAKVTAVYPLPAPPQDPITLLTGHGHMDQTGACPANVDTEIRFVRTGD